MLIHHTVIDDLALHGASLIIDAQETPGNRLSGIVRYWEKGTGTLTIRNAGLLPANVLVQIAQALKGRVTFEE